jgi:hypothetical protein
MGYSRAQLLEYERLFNQWCDAQKAAHAAVMAIVEDELAGHKIDPLRRGQAAALEVEARRLMMLTLRAAPPTTRS